MSNTAAILLLVTLSFATGAMMSVFIAVLMFNQFVAPKLNTPEEAEAR